jgi:glycosyltransferase involved in cell wall biosynthesis
MQRRLRRALAPHIVAAMGDEWRRHPVGLERYFAGFGGVQRPELTNTLPLKAPGENGEKGVLYSSFEYNWVRLVMHADARAILDRYYLVGQSSGSPPDFAAFAFLIGLTEDPIFIGVSNAEDVTQARIMAPVVEPLGIMASDWVDPAAFHPRPANAREIDIIMVANWLRVKRHWLLFEALRRMRRDLRVVLIGRNGEGRTEREIRAEARAFGVTQELEIYTNIRNDMVREHLCNAKVSLLLSYREGSCVAVTESLFADTPVAMAADAHVGSKAYINEQTGVLLHRRQMPQTLEGFLARHDTYRARDWARANVSCHHSTAKLNAALRAHAQRTNRPWTRDLAPLCWRYNPDYVNPGDEEDLLPAIVELQQRHSLRLARWASRIDAADAAIPAP